MAMIKSASIRIVYLGVMFVAGLVISNLTLPERFGTISFIILNSSFFSIATGLGGDSILLHKVANKLWGYGKATQFTWRMLFVQVLLFGALEAGSLILWKKTLLSNEPIDWLWLDAIYFTGLLLTEKYLTLLYAFQQAQLANLWLAVIAIVYLAVLLILPSFGATGFHVVLYYFAFQSLLQGVALLALFHAKNKIRDREQLAFREFFTAVKLSSIVMLTNVIQLLAYRVDFWLLNFYHGSYSVGVYAQANKFANLVWVVPNIFAQLLVPKFADLEKKELTGIFSLAFYFNFLSIVATAALALFFYTYYLDVSYKGGLAALCFMLPGYFFWAAVLYYAAYFSWAGKFSYNFWCSISCFVLIAIVDLLMIPQFGVVGAAWANTIVYTLVFLLYLFLMKKSYSFSTKELLLMPGKLSSTFSKLAER